MTRSEPIVLDATILINFKNVKRLDLLGRFERVFWCPRAVWEEAIAQTVPGYDARSALSQLRAAGHLRVIRVDEPDDLHRAHTLCSPLPGSRVYLDLGEAEAVVLCLRFGHPLASDDRAARSYLKAQVSRFTGIIGLLFSLMDRCVISVEEGQAIHNQMVACGYFSPYNRRGQFLNKYLSRQRDG